MDYKLVHLEEKKLVGLCARTGNGDPQMGAVIGSLWQRLFEEGLFFALEHKCNERSIGVYSDYADDWYDVTVGCEVSKTDALAEGVTVKTIPAGNYAEFVVHGDDMEAVGRAWGEIWSMPLDRTFTGDFEEYYEAPEGAPREIHLFIAVK